MKPFFAILTIFRTPTAEQLAQRELEEARRQLLVAHSSQEYAQTIVEYHRKRVSRLETLLRNPY